MDSTRPLSPEEIVNVFYAVITFVVLVSLWLSWPELEPRLRALLSVMSRHPSAPPAPEELAADDDAPCNNNRNNDEKLIATLQNEQNRLLLVAKAQALATLVHAKKIGQTEGIKMVFGVAPSGSNQTYLAARDALQAELARLKSLDTETPEEAEQRLRAMVAAAREE